MYMQPRSGMGKKPKGRQWCSGFGLFLAAVGLLYLKLFFTDFSVLCAKKDVAADVALSPVAQAQLQAASQIFEAPIQLPAAKSVVVSAPAAPSASASVAVNDPDYPWPMIKMMEDRGGEQWPWPGVGWKKGLTLDNPEFRGIKFYLYDDGVYDMRPAEACMRKIKGLGPDMSPESLEDMDKVVRVNEREYLTEFFLLPALREHPQRTMDPEEASIFVLGYAAELARMAMPCPETGPKEQWENRVAEELAKNKYYQRNQGRDHVYMHSRYKWDMSKKLHNLLDQGSIITTFDRYSPVLENKLPKTWQRGDVIVLPYVSSVSLDMHFEEPPMEKDDDKRYFFRGNMHRWGEGGGARAQLPALAQFLTGANFAEVDFFKVGKSSNMEPIIRQTAIDTRHSSICPAPEGDTPTSLRPFEALVSGCVPVIMGKDWQIARTLPYPSLIDWDKIALFTVSLPEIMTTKDGLKRLGAALESIAGPDASQQQVDRLNRMRKAGISAFQQLLSFFKNGRGVADGMLFESWVHLNMMNILNSETFKNDVRPPPPPAKQDNKEQD